MIGLTYYECCRHCGADCGAKDLHRFPCNKCQPRVKEQPILDEQYTH